MNPLFATEYVVLLALAAAGAGAWLIWRSSFKCKGVRRSFLVGLRAAAIIALGIVALNPGRWIEERYGRQAEWALLVDRSGSMATPDVGGQTRWSEAVRRVERIRRRIGDTAGVRAYTFSDRLESRSDGDLSGLRPDGSGTDILRAGRELLNRYRTGDKRLAGTIVISDGRQVGPGRPEDLAMESRAQESAIYVMPLGGKVARKDLSIRAARKLTVGAVGQKLRLSATVAGEGLGNVGTEVRLLDAAGTVLDRQKAEVPDGGTAPVSFEITPAQKGFFEYRLEVPPWEGESVDANNRATVGVAVLQDRIRVFVAEGTPGWDSKFLIQHLRNQPNLHVTSVYRVSAERFFKVETDASKVSEESEAAFPDAAGKLGAYDVVVFGKGAEYFLNPERLRWLRDFIREQGGCLVFARGKPYAGTFAEMEALEPMSWGDPIGAEFRFRPVRAGESAGLFGDLLPGVDDPVWKTLPALSSAHRSADLKAFTQVLVEGAFESAGRWVTFPAIAARRMGKGMILVVNAEGLWQWDFFPSVAEASRIYKDLWAQLLQWLVTYSEYLPGQEYALRLSETTVLPGTAVNARISKRGGDASAAPLVRVYEGGVTIQEIPGVPSVEAPNRWSAAISTARPDVYRVELAGLPGNVSGPCAVLQVSSPPTEADDASADPDFLGRLAEASGGAVALEDDLLSLVKGGRKAPELAEVGHTIWVSGWDRSGFLGAILVCLACEWFLRRRSGLM